MSECRLLGCALELHARGLCQFHYDRQRHDIPLDAPRMGTNIRHFDWAACGTASQYRKHLRHGIAVCDSCRRAENRRNQDRRLGIPTGDFPRRWTITEDEILMNCQSLGEAASALDRSYYSVKGRRERLEKQRRARGRAA